MKSNAILILTTVFLIGLWAHAENDFKKYENLTAQASVKIEQAIAKAQTELNGVAVNAELESKLGSVVYEIDVLAKGTMYEVFIDAKTGNIIQSREDLD